MEDNTTLYSKRLPWIDVGKGIGILLVVLGHVIRDSMRADSVVCNYLYMWIYSFHMPFLMFLSGYMFMFNQRKYQKLSFRNFFFKIVHRFLTPYVIYAVIVYAVIHFCFYIPVIKDILTSAQYKEVTLLEFLGGLLSGENQYTFHLWYIYVLGAIQLFLFTVFKFLNIYKLQRYTKVTLISIFVMAFCFTLMTMGNHFPRILSASILMLPWFVFGMLLKLHDHPIVPNFANFIAFILLAFMPSLSFAVQYPIFYRVVNGILVAFSIILFMQLSKQLQNSSLLSKLGKHSMSIYLYHQPFFAAGLASVLYDFMHINAFISIIIAWFGAIICASITDRILKKIGFDRIIFGRW